MKNGDSKFKDIGVVPFYVTNNILIENDNRHDFNTGFTSNPVYDNAQPYLMSIHGDSDPGRRRSITSASWEADKVIFEKYKCNYNPIHTDYNKFSNGPIYTWMNFFKYINEEILHEISNGHYSYTFNIPKEWIEENNILLMILRILYYKQYKCKVISYFSEVDNYFHYDLLIRWDNLPDEIFEENDTDVKLELPQTNPGEYSWTEVRYPIKEKGESLIERIFKKLKK